MSEEEKVVNEQQPEEKVSDASDIDSEDTQNSDPQETSSDCEEKTEQPAQEEPDDYKDKWLRVTAEYQNYRTRTQKEKAEIYANANEKFVTELLDVIDNFERAMNSKPEGDAFAEGIELIYKQFLAILDKEHVKEIPAKGEHFDPKLHMAVQAMPVDGLESDMVAEVIKKGYTLGDKVIRPAMVVVSQ